NYRSFVRKWLPVIAAGLVIFIAQLGTTIVVVALPSIRDELNIAPSVAQWVILSYLITLIALSLLSGRWIDQVGHRKALHTGITGFALASVMAGITSNVWILIAARAIQGTFGSVLLALAPVMAVGAV